MDNDLEAKLEKTIQKVIIGCNDFKYYKIIGKDGLVNAITIQAQRLQLTDSDKSRIAIVEAQIEFQKVVENTPKMPLLAAHIWENHNRINP